MAITKTASILLAILFLAGCSEKPAEEVTSDAMSLEEIAAEIDRVAGEILKASNNMEASSWLKRFPKTSLGTDADGKAIPLAPVAARLKEAGASRVVVEFSELSRKSFIISLVVVLPTKASRRETVFVLEPEMSRLYNQEPITDVGQKFLHYSFE